jgi:hypothetical protein
MVVFDPITLSVREVRVNYRDFHRILRPDGLYKSQMRFGMYRWHITDPVRFERDLRVTLQALEWRSGSRYLPLQEPMAVCPAGSCILGVKDTAEWLSSPP